MNKLVPLFAVCPKGVGPALAAELTRLGIPEVEERAGGVSFAGDLGVLYKAHLWASTASRILVPVSSFDCQDADDLYEGARDVPWETWLSPAGTLAVDANTHHSGVRDPRYAALKVKDAVCDYFRHKTGRRPSVDAEAPTLRINAHIANDRCVLSLDASGRGLHQRGYRKETQRAPLRETLAAALVEFSDWDTSRPFADPLCGSGTIAIEAAWRAMRAAPGLLRPTFGFQKWLDFDARLWRDLVEEAKSLRRSAIDVPILANDISPKAIAAARANARAAGVETFIRWSTGDARKLEPPSPQGKGKGPPGVILTNPPYGEWLGTDQELERLYKELGDWFQGRWGGWTLYLFTGAPALAKKIWLAPAKRRVLWNGPIECRLLTYELRGSPSAPPVK